MAIKFIATELPGVILVEPDVFADDRGHFSEVYHQEKYRSGGIGLEFIQDNFSFSKRGTLRGLHYQLKNPQAKLVTALAGEIFDVAVDIRPDSPTFKKWIGVKLGGSDKRQLFVPPGFAHGFCVLSETAAVLYKCSELYSSKDDRGILWSDEEIGIRWPMVPEALSAKDRIQPTLAEAKRLAILP